MFLKIRRFFNTNRISDLVDGRDGWYSIEKFVKVLRKERNRSFRSGLPHSCVLFLLSKENGGISVHKRKKLLKDFIEIISEHTRDYDVKYHNHIEKIGVLLIDTSMEGAREFIDKISKIYYMHLREENREDQFAIIQSISVCTFSSKKGYECEIYNVTPVIEKYLTFQKNV